MARNKNIEGPTETVEEYLARGGNVTVCPPCTVTDPELIVHSWKPKRGRKKADEHTPKKVDPDTGLVV
jgi:hypothetical protein